MPLLRRFLDANSRLSARLDRRKDQALFERYDADVTAAIDALPADALIVDLGGGRNCRFADAVRPGQRLVIVDVSEEELAANTSGYEIVLGDVTQSLPFDDGEVDLLFSRTVLEHVGDVEAAAANVARVMRPGGRTIHLVPGRYALFAIAARSLRFDVARRLLHVLQPATRGVVEFDVVYDRTHPGGLERTFRSAGFTDVEVQCTWDQSDYAAAIFPAFLAVTLYQRIAEALRIRALASYGIVRAIR
jgi:SAM-dependent methyltransferase